MKFIKINTHKLLSFKSIPLLYVLNFSFTEVVLKSYTIKANQRANGMSNTLHSVTHCESVISCAVTCTEDPSCTAANYDDDTSQCELLTSPTVWLTPQHGFMALIGQTTGKCIF